MKVNISLAQISINCNNFIKNYEKVIKIINSLPLKENHFLLLPELWLTGYSYSDFKKAFIFLKKNISNLLLLAKEKSVNIIGSVPWIENNQLFNRCIIIGSTGGIIGYYDKIHLFNPLKEHEYFLHGKTPCVIEITDICYGIMICYDLRFPELARKLVKKKCSGYFYN
jgi:predicted amidohydrolase